MESDEQIKFLPTEKTKSQDLIYKNLLPPSYDFNLHDTGETNDSEKLSLLVKMSFGYGGIGQYLYALVFGFFMSPFLLQVAGLPAISAGVIQSIVAVYGALINPVVGYLSDLSPHPRRISWIAFCLFFNSFFQLSKRKTNNNKRDKNIDSNNSIFICIFYVLVSATI